VRHDSSNVPGGHLTYAIWVWTTVASRHVTATAASRGTSIWRPRFTLCPAAHRRTCSIGSLPANQAIELLVTDHVGVDALTGEQMTLTVNVTAPGLSPAQATIATVVGAPTPSPTSFPVIPPVTFPGLPGTTVTPGSLSTLFPVVTPSASPAGTTKPNRRAASIRQASSALPLDPRLIGGQLAGLAVLAAAITMAIARLSLRTPSPAKATSGPDAVQAAAQPTDQTTDGAS
jgi:hypothetical protein